MSRNRFIGMTRTMFVAALFIVSAFSAMLLMAPSAVADLQPSDINITDPMEMTVEPSDYVDFNITVSNTNDAGDDAYVWMNITNPSDPSTDDWNATFGGVALSSEFTVPAGTSTTKKVAVRANATPMNYPNDYKRTYYVRVRVYSDAGHTDKQVDDSLSLKAEIEPNKGVSLSHAVGESRKKLAASGGSVSFDMVVTNKGVVEDKFNLAIDYSPSEWGEDVSISVSPTQTSNLIQDATEDITLNVDNIPLDAKNKSHKITVKATMNSDSSISTTLDAFIWVSASYGFSLSTESAFIDGTPGESVYIPVEVTNTGNTLNQKIYMNLSQPDAGSDSWDNSTPTTTILEGWGGSKIVNLQVKIPLDAEAESRRFVISAEPEGGGYSADTTIYIEVGTCHKATLNINATSTDLVRVSFNETAEFGFELTNDGNTVDTFIISVSNPPQGWDRYATPIISDLDHIEGSNVENFTLQVTTPDPSQNEKKDPAGDYSFTVNAYPQGYPDNGTSITVTVRLAQVHDTKLRAPEGNVTHVDPGEIGSIKCKLNNYGNVNDTFDIDVTMESSPENFTDTYTNTFVKESAAPPTVLDVEFNEFEEFYVNLTNNREKIVPGPYSFKVKVTSNGDAGVTSQMWFDYVVTEKYDVSLSIVGSDTNTTKPTEHAWFKLQVSNIGSVAETVQLSPSTYDVSISSVQINDTEVDINIDSYKWVWVKIAPKAGVPENTQINITINAKVEEDAKDITYDFAVMHVVVDPGYGSNLAIPLKEATTKAGRTVNFTTITRNDGNLADHFYLTPNPADLPNDDWQIVFNVTDQDGSVRTPTLEPKAKYYVQLGVVVPINAQPNTEIFLNITVSPESDITETDVQVVHIVVTDTYAVDFKPTDSQNSVDPGFWTNFTVKVWNKGTLEDTYTLEITSNIPQYMDPTPAIKDEVITIEAGKTATTTLTVWISDSDEYTLDPQTSLTVKALSENRTTVFKEKTFDIIINPKQSVELKTTDDDKSSQPDSTVTYTLSVRNTGDGTENFEVEYSTPNKYKGWVETSTSIISNLPAGATSQLYIYLTIPAKELPDIFTTTIIVFVEGKGHINDTLVLTTEIEAIYEFDMDSDQTSQKTDAGDSVDFTFSVDNTGTGSDIYDITIETEAYDEWCTLNKSRTQNVPADNTSDPILLTVDVPNDQEEGSYKITLRGTSRENTSIYQEITFEVKVNQEYLLSLSPIDSETLELNLGETDTVRYKLKNEGNGDDTISLSDFGSYASWSSISPESITIGPGNYTTITVTVTVPTDSSSIPDDNTADITIRATSEDDEQEMERIITVNIEPKPNTKLTTNYNTKQAYSGEYANFTVTLKNTGTEASIYWLELTSSYQAWAEEVDIIYQTSSGTKIQVPSIDPASSIVFTVSALILEGQQQDSYSMTVRGYPTEYDSSTYDDTLVLTVDIRQTHKVDVYTTSVTDQSKTTDPGQKVSFEFFLKNLGNGDDDFILSYTPDFKSTDWTFSDFKSSDVTISQSKVSGLSSSDIVKISIDVTAPSDTDTGSYTFRVTAKADITNPQESKGEVDSIDLTVILNQIYNVDLSLKDGSDSEEINLANTLTVERTYIIKNTGNGNDTFDLSVKNVPQGWTATLNKEEVTLDAGKDTTIELTVTLPALGSTEAGTNNGYILANAAKTLKLEATSQNSASATDMESLEVTIDTYHSLTFDTATISGLEVQKDGTVTTSVTVTNNGNLDETLTITTTQLNPADSMGIKYSADGGSSMKSLALTVNRGIAKTVEITMEPSSTADTGTFSFKVSTKAADLWQANYITVAGTIVEPEISIGTLKISPANPIVGDKVEASVQVSNEGTVDASDVTVELLVDGELEDTEKISLAAGESKTVTLRSSALGVGSHDIEVRLKDHDKKEEGSLAVEESSIIPGLPGGWMGLMILFVGVIILIVIVIAAGIAMSRGGDEEEELEKELEAAQKMAKEEKKPEKPEKKKAKKKPEEEDEVEPVHIRCPKCNTIQEITTAKRPVEVKCEKCGSKLLIKK